MEFAQHTIAAGVRPVLKNIDPTAVVDVQTISQFIRDREFMPIRVWRGVMTIIGTAGLILSFIGLYGVMAYGVSQRRREIGLRMALGAGRHQVRRAILLHGMKLSMTGILGGCLIASGLDMPLAKLVSGQPASPLVYVLVVVMSLAFSFLACYVPARRASLIDPNISLRGE